MEQKEEFIDIEQKVLDYRFLNVERVRETTEVRLFAINEPVCRTRFVISP